MLVVTYANQAGEPLKDQLWSYKDWDDLKSKTPDIVYNELKESLRFDFPDGTCYLLTEELNNNVDSPSHYTQGSIECLDAIESATIGKNGMEAVCVANVIKYLWRYENKNGLEDIKKAEHYLKKLIDTVEEKQ